VDTLDALESVYAKIPPMNCVGKCSYACYQSIAFLDAEHDAITDRIGGPIPDRVAPGPCPLLTFLGTCKVYDIRPLICRIWGATEATRCKHGCEPVGGRLLSEVEVAELFADAAEATGDEIAGELRELVRHMHSDPEVREVIGAVMRGEHSPELSRRRTALQRRIGRRA
jgi:Fe-S-cluster containining protein